MCLSLVLVLVMQIQSAKAQGGNGTRGHVVHGHRQQLHTGGRHARTRVHPSEMNLVAKATFCGSTLNDRAGQQFTAQDLESIGYHFLDSFLDYSDPDRTKVSARNAFALPSKLASFEERGKIS